MYKFYIVMYRVTFKFEENTQVFKKKSVKQNTEGYRV